MKKLTHVIMIAAVFLFGFISSITTSAATAESITEGTEWSGTIEGVKELTFIPAETGFYNVRLTDSEDTYTNVSFLTENNVQVMDSIIEYDTGIYMRNAIFLIKGKEYKVKIECRDEIDDGELLSGDASLLITKSSDNSLALTEIKKAANAIQNGNSICTYTPAESGTYSFTFQPKTGESSYFIDLYALQGESFNIVTKKSRYLYNQYTSTLFQLEAGTEYYFIVNYSGGECEDGTEFPAYSSIKQSNTIASIELREEPLVSSSDIVVFLSAGSIKINYTNGTSDIIQFSDMNRYDINAEYLGERDKESHFKAGKQKVKFTYLDAFEITSEINVLTKVQYAEKIYGTLPAGRKISVDPDFWYYAEYKFTPSRNGYYVLWYNTPDNLALDKLYKEWEFTVHDSQDNEIEWISNKGFKLKANEDYCFEISLGSNLTQNKFTYWLDINTDHIHTYGPWVTTKPSTTTQAGTKERTCTDCGATETKTIDKLTPPALTPPAGNENNIQAGSNGSGGAKKPPVTQDIKPSNPSKTNLAKIVLKSVKACGKGKIKVKWKKSTAAKGYQLQYSTNKKFKSKKTKTTSKTSLTIKKLKKKKTYYIRVRAYKKVNGKKTYGKWSSVKRIKIRK